MMMSVACCEGATSNPVNTTSNGNASDAPIATTAQQQQQRQPTMNEPVALLFTGGGDESAATFLRSTKANAGKRKFPLAALPAGCGPHTDVATSLLWQERLKPMKSVQGFRKDCEPPKEEPLTKFPLAKKRLLRGLQRFPFLVEEPLNEVASSRSSTKRTPKTSKESKTPQIPKTPKTSKISKTAPKTSNPPKPPVDPLLKFPVTSKRSPKRFPCDATICGIHNLGQGVKNPAERLIVRSHPRPRGSNDVPPPPQYSSFPQRPMPRRRLPLRFPCTIHDRVIDECLLRRVNCFRRADDKQHDQKSPSDTHRNGNDDGISIYKPPSPRPPSPEEPPPATRRTMTQFAHNNKQPQQWRQEIQVHYDRTVSNVVAARPVLPAPPQTEAEAEATGRGEGALNDVSAAINTGKRQQQQDGAMSECLGRGDGGGQAAGAISELTLPHFINMNDEAGEPPPTTAATGRGTDLVAESVEQNSLSNNNKNVEKSNNNVAESNNHIGGSNNNQERRGHQTIDDGSIVGDGQPQPLRCSDSGDTSSQEVRHSATALLAHAVETETARPAGSTYETSATTATTTTTTIVVSSTPTVKEQHTREFIQNSDNRRSVPSDNRAEQTARGNAAAAHRGGDNLPDAAATPPPPSSVDNVEAIDAFDGAEEELKQSDELRRKGDEAKPKSSGREEREGKEEAERVKESKEGGGRGEEQPEEASRGAERQQEEAKRGEERGEEALKGEERQEEASRGAERQQEAASWGEERREEATQKAAREEIASRGAERQEESSRGAERRQEGEAEEPSKRAAEHLEEEPRRHGEGDSPAAWPVDAAWLRADASGMTITQRPEEPTREEAEAAFEAYALSRSQSASPCDEDPAGQADEMKLEMKSVKGALPTKTVALGGSAAKREPTPLSAGGGSLRSSAIGGGGATHGHALPSSKTTYGTSGDALGVGRRLSSSRLSLTPTDRATSPVNLYRPSDASLVGGRHYVAGVTPPYHSATDSSLRSSSSSSVASAAVPSPISRPRLGERDQSRSLSYEPADSFLPSRTRLRRQKQLSVDEPEDPIEKLNRLRARISGALSEVKGVLKQYSTDAEGEPSDTGPVASTTKVTSHSTDAAGTASQPDKDEGPVTFRFVRKVRRRSIFNEDDKESPKQEVNEGGKQPEAPKDSGHRQEASVETGKPYRDEDLAAEIKQEPILPPLIEEAAEKGTESSKGDQKEATEGGALKEQGKKEGTQEIKESSEDTHRKAEEESQKEEKKADKEAQKSSQQVDEAKQTGSEELVLQTDLKTIQEVEEKDESTSKETSPKETSPKEASPKKLKASEEASKEPTPLEGSPPETSAKEPKPKKKVSAKADGDAKPKKRLSVKKAASRRASIAAVEGSKIEPDAAVPLNIKAQRRPSDSEAIVRKRAAAKEAAGAGASPKENAKTFVKVKHAASGVKVAGKTAASESQRQEGGDAAAAAERQHSGVNNKEDNAVPTAATIEATLPKRSVINEVSSTTKTPATTTTDTIQCNDKTAPGPQPPQTSNSSAPCVVVGGDDNNDSGDKTKRAIPMVSISPPPAIEANSQPHVDVPDFIATPIAPHQTTTTFPDQRQTEPKQKQQSEQHQPQQQQKVSNAESGLQQAAQSINRAEPQIAEAFTTTTTTTTTTAIGPGSQATTTTHHQQEPQVQQVAPPTTTSDIAAACGVADLTHSGGEKSLSAAAAAAAAAAANKTQQAKPSHAAEAAANVEASTAPAISTVEPKQPQATKASGEPILPASSAETSQSVASPVAASPLPPPPADQSETPKPDTTEQPASAEAAAAMPELQVLPAPVKPVEAFAETKTAEPIFGQQPPGKESEPAKKKLGLKKLLRKNSTEKSSSAVSKEKAAAAKKGKEEKAISEASLAEASSTEAPLVEASASEASLAEASLLEADSEAAAEVAEAVEEPPPPPPPRPPRKVKKKVIIKRQHRKLSVSDISFFKAPDEDNGAAAAAADQPDTETVEKAIAYVTDDEDDDTVYADEEPAEPPKPLKTCMRQREYQIGDRVMYAERYKKTQVRWKKGVVLDRITSISYKLEIDGKEVPAHISYIKRYTDRKVNFSGKEYLEIDYEQIAEEEKKVRSYSIWNMV